MTRLSTRFVATASLCLLAGCGGSGGGSRSSDPADGAGSDEVLIDLAVTHQHISGFGASSAWTFSNASDSLADQFFSAETGIGLSLLRVRITPSGTTGELATAQKAVARGARVWAAPWSPPGEWKSNNSDRQGGRLLPEHYADWAERLTTFVSDLDAAGVPLLVLSAQNEPNWVATWETCEWSPEELTTFVRDELGPRLDALGLDTHILAPETNDWNTIARYGDALLNDAGAARYLSAVATHAYGGRAFAYATPAMRGKELWQTEMSDPTKVSDSGIDSGLRIARLIHDHLTIAEVSAWHYWWLIPGAGADDNGALTRDGALTRRAYALGNWSRFVRPDFVRVEATTAPRPGVSVSAFRDEASRRVVIVAINDGTRDQKQDFALSGGEFQSVTPWTTSAELALVAGEPLALSAGKFSAQLPKRSITSFVGSSSDSPPNGAGGAPSSP
ncbi:MAG TPA: glycoside hydrolase [Polyangiaceae bacterium]|nr:glycoside hydrolase [Polyangiaceae bacterium]